MEIRDKIMLDYGDEVSNKVISRILESINRLEFFEKSGVKISSVLGVKSDYRYIYAEKNYIFYRITDESIKIITVLNEKQDFMQILFGINTTPLEMEEYWDE